MIQGLIVFSMLLFLIVVAAKVIGAMFEDAARGEKEAQQEDDSQIYEPDDESK